MQQRVIGAKQARRGQRGSSAPSPRGRVSASTGSASTGSAGSELRAAVLALTQLSRDRAQPAPCVAQRQPGPLGEVTLAGGRVSREEPACQLGQRRVTVEGTGPEPGGRRAEPVADPDERVLAAGHRPADDQAADRRARESVHERLALRPDPGRGDHVAELGAGERAVRGESRVDELHRFLSVVG